MKKDYKVVSIQITIPAGKHCFKVKSSGEHIICEHFDNAGGYAKCELSFRGQTKAPDGIFKSDKCKKLTGM